MSDWFKDRVALVTGGSRGIGRAIGLRLAGEGADLVVTYRQNQPLVAEVVEAAAALGRRAVPVKADLIRKEDVEEIFRVTREEFGRLDIFVANAAATAFRPLLEQKDYNVERTFAVKVTAFILAAQQAVSLMPNGSGRIVAISGIDSTGVMAGHGLLGAAKASMETLVRYLAYELGPRGITVNGVCPGFIETDSSRLYLEKGLGKERAEATARLTALTPRRRLGRPADVASLVAFLCSDEADFLTGQTIILDGGLDLLSPMATI